MQAISAPSFPYVAHGAIRLILLASGLLLLHARSGVELDSRGRASMRRELSTLQTEEQEMQVFKTDIELPGLESVSYEPAFFEKCLHKWQKKCRSNFKDDHESDEMFCETNLDRNYLKARLLVPKDHIRAHFDHSQSGLTARNKTVYEGFRLPKYTELGYEKHRLDPDLHDRFLTWFRKNRVKAFPEAPPVTGKWCNNDYDNDDYVLPWFDNGAEPLVMEVRAQIIPALEEWAQVKLDPDSITYGARMYHRGSICAMHNDETSDHIISAIYHLDVRGLDEEWPLDVIDHNGREKSIGSQPGDLIFYESATTPHGRKGTLQGEEFVNIFFHFKPIGWKQARDAAFMMMTPYDMSLEHFDNAEDGLAPRTFHADDKCLPYGTTNSFSGAYNTSVMHLALTHDGKGVHTGVDGHKMESLLDSPSQGLEVVEKRMSYWKNSGEKGKHTSGKPLGKSTKYMMFDIDVGGLNNIRIGWEMAGLIAFHTGRTLVLPPAMPWYLIDNGPGVADTGSTSLIEDFVNLPQMKRGLDVVTFAEFASKEFPGTSLESTREAWQEFASKHATVVNSSCDLYNYNVKDRMIYVHDNVDKGSRLFACSHWGGDGSANFLKGGHDWETPASFRTLLRNHFVWHPEVIHLASHVVHKLGLFQYAALHARYNDFQFTAARESPQAIVDRWMDNIDGWLGTGDTIYVSTDASNPREFVGAVQERMQRPTLEIKRPVKVMLAADVFDNPTSPIASILADMTPKRVQQLKGPIEQAICSFAKVFIGTEQSTFSAYIELMRSRANAPQHAIENSLATTRLVHTQDPSQEQVENVERQLELWEPRSDVLPRPAQPQEHPKVKEVPVGRFQQFFSSMLHHFKMAQSVRRTGE